MRFPPQLWEQAEFFAALDSLGAAAGAELVEGATAVSLHGVLAHEEGFADLAVAQAPSHEIEDFQLAAGDAEALADGVGGGEVGCRGGGDGDFDDAVYDRSRTRSRIRSRGARSLVPSQMPAPAKRMAIRTP